MIIGSPITTPQFLEDATAETTRHALHRGSTVGPAAQHATMKCRCAQSDRLSCQRKAEKHVALDRGGWLHVLTTDLYHNVEGGQDKTMRLVTDIINGL